MDIDVPPPPSVSVTIAGTPSSDTVRRQKSAIRKNRSGGFVKVVREHYLRRDITVGSALASAEARSHAGDETLESDADHYLLPDVHVALSYLDLLEAERVSNIVLCTTVLEEVRRRNFAAFGRLRQLMANPSKHAFVFANEHHVETYVAREAGETEMERAGRALRAAAAFYNRVVPAKQTILLTVEKENRVEVKFPAMNVLQYVEEKMGGDPALLDLVLRDKEEELVPNQNARSQKKRRRAAVFSEHLSVSAITAGIQEGRLYQGALRVSRFNPFEAFIGVDGVGDVNVSGRVHMNRAMDGDIVAFEILPESKTDSGKISTADVAEGEEEGEMDEKEMEYLAAQEDVTKDAGNVAGIIDVAVEGIDDSLIPNGKKQMAGKIVGIIKRNVRDRGYCGSLKPQLVTKGANKTERVLFIPVERRFPMMMIQTRQYDTLKDKRIVVRFDGWDVCNNYPHAHYVKTLGVAGDKATETAVVLHENDIDDSPFTPDVYACVPPLPWKVMEEDINDPNREDLRHLDVCSVDPPGCRDIDDALHCRDLNGDGSTVEVGVHIADVTHFMRPNTPLDVEAGRRCTSTYLVDRRIDMLPKALTEDICSLKGGVERLAFSVLWEMDYATAKVKKVRFMRSVIRSRAALSYVEAQTRMDDKRVNDVITSSLRKLNHLAKIRKKGRIDEGALQLASPEVKFELDTETHDPTDVGVYVLREANQMVEEFMLLANETVAEKILSSYPSASVLRRHPTPTPRMLEPLIRAAGAVDFNIDASTSKSLATSLDKAVRKEDPYFNKLIRIQATRCMTPAEYFGSGDMSRNEYKHYGLAMRLYTHFTSPIRRYADDIVHRLLAAAIGIDTMPDIVTEKTELRDQVDRLNYRHRNAQLAGRASAELHTLLFFKKRPDVAEARVTRVRKNGIIVFIPRYGIEGPIILTDDGATKTSVDENAQVLRFGAKTFKIFDMCTVQISVQEGQVGSKLVLTLKEEEVEEEEEEDNHKSSKKKGKKKAPAPREKGKQ